MPLKYSELSNDMNLLLLLSFIFGEMKKNNIITIIKIAELCMDILSNF